MPSGGELGDLKREIEVLREEIASLRSKEALGDSDGGQQFSTTQSDRTATAGTDDRATQSWRESGFLFARKHRYILPIVAVVIVAIVVGGYFLWGYLHSYESTGDAKIAGTITPISSEVAGKISKVLVRNGQQLRQVNCCWRSTHILISSPLQPPRRNTMQREVKPRSPHASIRI